MALPAIFAVPGVVEGILDAGKNLIDRLFPDKVAQAKERAEAELRLEEMRRDGTLKEKAVQLSAIIAEAQSEDPWTSRARPSFLYVMYVMILFAIPMGVLSAFQPEIATAISAGMEAYLSAIPEQLWWLFGTGYLGYTVTREFSKRGRGK